MEFDASCAWARLRAKIASKPSHGKKDLLAYMGELEAELTSDTGFSDEPPERRRPSRPATRTARARTGDGRDSAHPLTDPEEDGYGSSDQHRAEGREPARA